MDSIRELVINYLGGRCNHCGITCRLELHHTLPLYAGGKNVMGNVEVVCNSCHKKLHAQLIKIYPAAEQDNKLSRRVTEANIEIEEANVEIEEADKAEAVGAIRNLIGLGVISKDDIPDELKSLV